MDEEYRIALLKAKKAAEDLIPYFPPTEEELLAEEIEIRGIVARQYAEEVAKKGLISFH